MNVRVQKRSKNTSNANQVEEGTGEVKKSPEDEDSTKDASALVL